MGVAPTSDSLPANLAAIGTCQPVKSWWKRRDLHPPSGTANATRPYGTCVPMKNGGGLRGCAGLSRSSDARHHWIGLTSTKTGPRRRYRAVVCRLSAGCSAFELIEGKGGRGARDCTEPRSFGDSAGHWTVRPCGCRTGIRTRDLLVMSQTSYRCSILQQRGARGRYRADYLCLEDRHVSMNTSRA